MDKFIPYEKLSKKKRREIDRKKRNTWNGFSPVTRKPEDPKVYNRRRTRVREEDPDARFFVFFLEIMYNSSSSWGGMRYCRIH